jgi:hypothetical protein
LDNIIPSIVDILNSDLSIIMYIEWVQWSKRNEQNGRGEKRKNDWHHTFTHIVILNNKNGYMHRWCVGGEVQNDSL